MIHFTKEQEVCKISSYDGLESLLVLPKEAEDGRCVSQIGPKAFFHCLSVCKLVVPDSIEVIGDWAFSQMQNLREITLPKRKLTLGRKVFSGCERLEQLFIDGQDMEGGIPYFLASYMTVLAKEDLDIDSFAPVSFLERYDEALVRFLRMPDDTGFEPAFIGWFDVEDVDDQRLDYMRKKRSQKIHLTMRRLYYDMYLKEADREEMISYLLAHPEPARTAIRVSTGEQIVLEDVKHLILALFAGEDKAFGRDKIFVQAWEKIGGFHVLSPEELLDHMEEAEPEVRAFLIGKKITDSCEKSLFDGLLI